MTQAAAQAATDRIADQQLAATTAAASKAQFDALLAAITELKAEKAASKADTSDNDGEELIDKNAPGSTRKLRRTASEGSKTRSRSAQRSGQ